jgi:hypothetical protein
MRWLRLEHSWSVLCSCAALLTALGCGEDPSPAVAAPPSGLIGEARYPLDVIPRETAKGQAACVPKGLVTYGGDVLTYDQPVQVHPAFVPRLRDFERLVVKTAREFYGRAPSRLVQMGAYRCRPKEKPRRLLSEHGLGNALDVAGVRFGPAKPNERVPRGAPDALREPFEVRIETHWKAGGRERVHREFLRELARRVIAARDMFRVVLGPAYPDHENHLHVDYAPYRLVRVF